MGVLEPACGSEARKVVSFGPGVLSQSRAVPGGSRKR